MIHLDANLLIALIKISDTHHLTAGRTRLDAIIAAIAIHTGAQLATVNAGDFEPFVPHGLKLHYLA